MFLLDLMSILLEIFIKKISYTNQIKVSGIGSSTLLLREIALVGSILKSLLKRVIPLWAQECFVLWSPSFMHLQG
jgi:hypothetical protein